MPDLYDKVIIVGQDGEAADVVGGALQTSGGGGGGGAVTVADGADVTQGAIADAAVITDTTGTVSGKLRGIVALLAGTLRMGGSVASDAAVTDNPLLNGGRASTAVPSAVSADGDAVASWLTRNGAAVVDGGVASAATDSGNPVKVGAKYNSTNPTFTDGQRGDLQIGARGALRVELWRPDGGTSIGTSTAFSDGLSNSAAAIYAAVFPSFFNGTTWDRIHNNEQATLLSSAARTVATSSADQTNYNGRGVAIITNVTVEGAATLTLTVQGKDSISSNYYDLITGIIVYTAASDAPPTTRAVVLYPGTLTADAIGIAGATGMTSKSVALPRTWRVTITPADATTTTYSVSAVTLL